MRRYFISLSLALALLVPHISFAAEERGFFQSISCFFSSIFSDGCDESETLVLETNTQTQPVPQYIPPYNPPAQQDPQPQEERTIIKYITETLTPPPSVSVSGSGASYVYVDEQINLLKQELLERINTTTTTRSSGGDGISRDTLRKSIEAALDGTATENDVTLLQTQTTTLLTDLEASLIAQIASATSAINQSQWTTSGSNISYMGGNVGVGTTTPNARLAIVSATNSTISSSFDGSSIQVFDGNAAFYPTFALSSGATLGYRPSDAATYNAFKGNQTIIYSGTAGTNGIALLTESAPIIFGHNGNYGFTWNMNNLTAVGGNGVSLNMAINSNLVTGNIVGGSLNPNGGTSEYSALTIQGGAGTGTNVPGFDLNLSGGRSTGSANGGAIKFSTNAAGGSGSALNASTERMRILANGYVGIGTTTPNSKLTVVGGGLFTGGITSPGVTGEGEAFGLGASINTTIVGGAHGLAVGRNAAASYRGTAIGTNASSVGDQGIAIGISAQGNTGVAVGAYSSASARSVSLGISAVSGAWGTALGDTSTAAESSIALGVGAVSTLANQLVIGGDFGPGAPQRYSIENVFIGNGVTAASPLGAIVQTTGGSGTNAVGSNLTLAGGKGTGNASGGALIFSTSDAGASGSTLQSLSEKMRITAAGNIGIGTPTPTSILDIRSVSPTLSLGISAGTNSSKIDLVNPSRTWSLENQYVGGAELSLFRLYNSTTGSNALTVIGNSNNVGIGTANPSYKLDVAGDLNISNVHGGTMYFGNTNSYVSNYDNQFNFGSVAGMTFNVNGGGGSPTTAMMILNTGKVGIGTTNPIDILDVSKSESGGMGGRGTFINPAAGAPGNTTGIGFKVNSNFVSNYYTAQIQSINTNVGNDNRLGFFVYNPSDSGTPGGYERLSIVGNTGYVGIGTTTPEHLVTLSGGAYSDGASWQNASSRELKENFTELLPSDILSRIEQLDIMQWNYKGESNDIKHIGPVAEQFYELFSLGGSNTSISTIDPAGVALVGIQALKKGFDEVFEKVEDGIVYLKDVAINTLRIGSPEQSTRIGVFDEQGNEGCLRIVDVSSGDMRLTEGPCSEDVGDANAGDNTNTQDPTNPDGGSSSDTATSTPQQTSVEPEGGADTQTNTEVQQQESGGAPEEGDSGESNEPVNTQSQDPVSDAGSADSAQTIEE